MATQSKPYKQGFVPSLIINGLVAGMMFIFLLGGAYVGYVFYNTVKGAVVKVNLPGLPSIDLALPIASVYRAAIVCIFVFDSVIGRQAWAASLYPNASSNIGENIPSSSILRMPVQ